MSTTTQKIIVSAAGTLGTYVLFFGFPFQGAISTHVYNRAVLKQKKMEFAHEEAMARIKKETE